MSNSDGSGYGRNAIVPEEDPRLTHVTFGTPMGELMRRYWHPVCLSSELGELPRFLRILGEELVAYRDKSGRVGVLGAHCAHRGTSLEYGRIEENGIRCCYHGWLYDHEGRCLDQPGEPELAFARIVADHGQVPGPLVDQRLQEFDGRAGVAETARQDRRSVLDPGQRLLE